MMAAIEGERWGGTVVTDPESRMCHPPAIANSGLILASFVLSKNSLTVALAVG
jgi:hypothetical protein